MMNLKEYAEAAAFERHLIQRVIRMAYWAQVIHPKLSNHYRINIPLYVRSFIHPEEELLFIIKWFKVYRLFIV